MYDGKAVGVVVPAYNEAGHIGEVIETMPAYVDRIYAIDDASSDGTWAEIREYARRQNERAAIENGSAGTATRTRVVPIRHEQNRGAGGAVKTGYARALEDGMDVIAVMDGDGQMDPAHLERVIEPVAAGEVTYAKGNRLRSVRDCATMSRWRLFGNILLTMLTRVSSGYWELSDPQNGFTAISSEGLRAVDFDRLYDGYGFLNDLLFALNVNREPVADVAHPARYGDERSTIRYSTFIPRLSALIARNFLTRIARSYVLRRFHPIVACYALGAIVTVVGVAGGGYSVVSAGVDAFVGGMASLSVATLGLLLMLFGTWLDVVENEGLVQDIGAPAMDEHDPVGPVDRRFDVAHDGGTAGDGTGVDGQ
ncbi:glycosyltransferase family 2 protein [Halorubrum sp. HHNYT27]|uniref:glycosyltransferase family 2 protein n=1 Tax=Halorubrum sp. HHNYT27 TaxID=3402275 RepID=UPI003EB91A01